MRVHVDLVVLKRPLSGASISALERVGIPGAVLMGRAFSPSVTLVYILLEDAAVVRSSRLARYREISRAVRLPIVVGAVLAAEDSRHEVLLIGLNGLLGLLPAGGRVGQHRSFEKSSSGRRTVPSAKGHMRLPDSQEFDIKPDALLLFFHISEYMFLLSRWVE